MNASLERHDLQTLQKGYFCKPDGSYVCLACGAVFAAGEVYRINDALHHGEKAAQMHVQQIHGERFDYLLENGQSFLPITDRQKEIINLLYRGLSDVEIATKTGISQATVQCQRIIFKEKAKQAKLFLALYELVGKNNSILQESADISSLQTTP